MTEKEKAKAYDEAIAKAQKELQSCGSTDCDAARQIYRFFPELKESEDERIRKEIISHLQHEHVVKRYVSDVEYDRWIAWLEKQGEQKPAEKIEPKFQHGQWIVWQNKCYKVNYNGRGYELIDQNGLSTSLECGTIDENAHLWDITKDAKDGDVLTTTHCNGIGQITLIFKRIVDDNMFCYCLYDSEMSDKLCFDPCTESDFIGCVSGAEEEFHPATKEQRDLLFAKMKEAGYEWDAEKKELKMLENQGKSMWTEEDEKRLQSCISELQGKGLMGGVDTIDTKWLKALKQRLEK